MNCYICTNFTGHYPVGVAAIVTANSPEEAAERLNDELRVNHGLRGDATAADMTLALMDYPTVRVLCDGDY